MQRPARSTRWRRFFRRTGVGLAVAFVAVFLPCASWTPAIFTYWQVPTVVLAFILYMGVLLFETMFFDRYH